MFDKKMSLCLNGQVENRRFWNILQIACLPILTITTNHLSVVPLYYWVFLRHKRM